jgi:molybdopterin-guanine dinucleotide biosynthesis protein A
MQKKQILGVILAGGVGSRFGTDKSAALLGGKPLMAWIVARARPQVAALLVNANSEITAASGIERLADNLPGEGPLAGILAALEHAASRGFTHVASFACDTPFFPHDTVARLSAALYEVPARYAVARCGETVHRIFALWPVSDLQTLKTAFEGGARSMRSIENWLTAGPVDFPAGGGPEGDPFFNINTLEDLAAAESWMSGQHDQLRI